MGISKGVGTMLLVISWISNGDRRGGGGEGLSEMHGLTFLCCEGV